MTTSYSLLQALASCRGSQTFIDRVYEVLAPEAIRSAFAADTKRERLYHALPLFQTFLNQALHGCSCRDAISHGTVRGWLPPKTCPQSAAYCNARQRLSEAPLRQLVCDVGTRLAAAAPRAAGERPIRVVDGSSVTLADTPKNQAEYPQPSQQAPHCGFPVLHFTALMDHASGALLDLEMGNGSDNERTLFRRLWKRLARGDILLGDRGFDGFADTALLQQQGIDTIFRLHATRKINLRRAVKNGAGDWTVKLPAPVRPPAWVGEQTLPPQLSVRIIEFQAPRCCRHVGRIRLITTLLDTVQYPKAWIMAQYLRRWRMELHLRDIKITLGLDRLGGCSPAMCRKQLLMGLLVYNLIRRIMLCAAQSAEVSVERISFKGSWVRYRLCLQAPLAQQQELFDLVFQQMVKDLVPPRPNRIEARCVKRRPKHYPQLASSRKTAQRLERQRNTR